MFLSITSTFLFFFITHTHLLSLSNIYFSYLCIPPLSVSFLAHLSSHRLLAEFLIVISLLSLLPVPLTRLMITRRLVLFASPILLLRDVTVFIIPTLNFSFVILMSVVKSFPRAFPVTAVVTRALFVMLLKMPETWVLFPPPPTGLCPLLMLTPSTSMLLMTRLRLRMSLC